MYLMGGHRYKVSADWYGATWRWGQDDALGMVFMFKGYPPVLSNQARTATELHEPACHDASVGAIDHCTTVDICACKSGSTDDEFCAGCVAELKAAQDLDN